MWDKITLCNTSSHSFVENTICDITNTSIFIQTHHGNTSIMVSAYKKITVLIIYFDITSSHTTNPLFIDWFEIPVF